MKSARAALPPAILRRLLVSDVDTRARRRIKMARAEAVTDSQHNRKNHYALPRPERSSGGSGGVRIRVMPPQRAAEDGVIGLGGALARCDGERMDRARTFSRDYDRGFLMADAVWLPGDRPRIHAARTAGRRIKQQSQLRGPQMYFSGAEFPPSQSFPG